MDPAWFRQVLGQYPTGVCVVTGIGIDGAPTGLVVGSFTSVSLEPPIVAFFPDQSSSSWPKIRPSKGFCVNVLAQDQEHLCRQFAAKGGDKFAGVGWRPAESGSPVLDHVVAWIDCRLAGVHNVGDHDLVLGRVLELEVERPSNPLLFFRGGYGRFRSHTLALGDADLRRELHLVDSARDQMEAVASELDGQCVAWALAGDEIVLLASSGAPERPGVPARMVGARMPTVPPMGSTFMAYADDRVVDAWLHRAAPELRDGHARRIEQMRERGYTVALRSPELVQLEHAVEGDHPGDPAEVFRSLPLDPLDFDPATQAPEVATITVPAFGPDGDVQLLLGLHGFCRLKDASELERIVEQMREAARVVTGAAEGSTAPAVAPNS